jgi:uncharacterized protein
MPVDHIRYDILAQEALRGLVRHVLADAAKEGLPGDHHFFITIDTRAGGVKLSPRLMEQYPEEMTVVLQHQFWDLKVTDEAFEVGLSFGGVAERLFVPFAAVKSFVDPSVKFALQFETITDSVQDSGEGPSGAEQATDGSVGDTTAGGRKPARRDAARQGLARTSVPSTPLPGPAAAPADGEHAEPPEPPDGSSGGAEVVRLDRFRKK